ncbi:S8 family serine peptidase [Aspergillus udagawae]|nr:S8 family serine peptidase [Aspergillus udagawae]
MPAIVINGNEYDPDEPQLLSGAFDPSGHILIHTSSFLDDDNIENLHELGADVEEYVSNDTYLCHYTGELTKLQELSFIDHAFNYHPQLKVEKHLKEQPKKSEHLSETPKTHIHLRMHQSVEPSDNIRYRVARAAQVNDEDVTMDGHDVEVETKAEYLENLSHIPEVRDIHEVHPVELANCDARETMGAVNIQNNGIPYKGKGEIIAVADSGLDFDHPAFDHRILESYNLHGIGDAVDRDGHGTHVSGSVLGNALNFQPEVIEGVAPEAKILVQSLMVKDEDNQKYNFCPLIDHAELFDRAYKSGGRVHTDSWTSSSSSSPSSLGYDFRSRQIDEFIWSHADMVICFAAGNSKIGIKAEAASKNCITVGATEDRDDTLKRCPEKYWAWNNHGQSRNKPDIFAPGKGILSARSTHTSTPLPMHGNNSRCCCRTGTSMANALIAGCVGVIRESLRPYSASPSAALVKALLICGADLLKPDTEIKRVNLSNTVNISLSRSFEEAMLGRGHEYRFPILTTTQTSDDPDEVIVTLVWTDPAGPLLQSKLELTVESVTRKETNTGNSNVLQVRMKRPGRRVNVAIRAAQVAISLDPPRQPYACVWRWA